MRSVRELAACLAKGRDVVLGSEPRTFANTQGILEWCVCVCVGRCVRACVRAWLCVCACVQGSAVGQRHAFDKGLAMVLETKVVV